MFKEEYGAKLEFSGGVWGGGGEQNKKRSGYGYFQEPYIAFRMFFIFCQVHVYGKCYGLNLLILKPVLLYFAHNNNFQG